MVLFGHPSQSGKASGDGTSGNVAWSNSVRSRLYLDRIIKDGIEADPNARVLTVKKANFTQRGQSIALRWDAGVFVADGAKLPPQATASADHVDIVFLDLLEWHISNGQHVSPNPSSVYAPALFAAHAQAGGITKAGFKAAMYRLFDKKLIETVRTGPASRSRIDLVPCRTFSDASDPTF